MNFHSFQITSNTKKIITAFFTLIALVLSGSVYATAITVPCSGQMDSSDRISIQSAIDRARSGDTIMLVGTCQLDGNRIFITKSNLTITGAGQAGNWSSVIRGIASSNHPDGVGDNPDGSYYNRGLNIGALDGSSSVSNVTIQNLKFQYLYRGIMINPQLGGNSALCSGYNITNSRAVNIVVKNNWFDSDVRGAQAIGNTNNIVISDNLFTTPVADSIFFNEDILIGGKLLVCNGAPGSLSIGVPMVTNIVGNTNQNDNAYTQIYTAGTANLSILNNTFKNTSNGNAIIDLGVGSTNSLIANNQLDLGGLSYVYIKDYTGVTSPNVIPSANNLIYNNLIKNGAPGIYIDSDSTGYTMLANKFQGSVAGFQGDIFFCDGTTNNYCAGTNGLPSYNNVVVTPYCTNVINLGSNNTLIGLLDISTDANNPPNGMCQWMK